MNTNQHGLLGPGRNEVPSSTARQIAHWMGISESEYLAFKAQNPSCSGAGLSSVVGGQAALDGGHLGTMSPEARQIAQLMGISEGEYLAFKGTNQGPATSFAPLRGADALAFPSRNMLTGARVQVALLASALALLADGRAQVLPAGDFKARDGRPGPGKTWRLSEERGAALAASINSTAARTPLVVDYDHQTIHASKTGAKAPAAGWMKAVEWVPQKGMFSTVAWTDSARRAIAAGEYLFFSPVIEYDDDTGEITNVLMGSLVNYPAILGMDQVMASLSGGQAPMSS